MRYVGGKSKIAKELSVRVLELSKSRKYYLEPFVGGGAMFSKMAPNFEWSVAGDAHEDLILMWNALLDGWNPPEVISESEYAVLKESDPSAIRALAGFGGSFGGKWFGGYARGGVNADKTPRNHQGESARAIMRISTSLASASVGAFRNQSYADWAPVAGTVVYCDPPYADTQGYSTGGFDSSQFWSTMDDWAELGCEVFVSEYSAPDHWECVWEKEHRQSLVRPEQGRNSTIERLFTSKA